MVIDVFQLFIGFNVKFVVIIRIKMVQQGFKTRENTCHDHACCFLHLFGQYKCIRDAAAGGGFFIPLDQGDMGVFQGFKPCGHGQFIHKVKLAADAVFRRQIKIAEFPGQLNHITGVHNIHKPGITTGLLVYPGNVHIHNFVFLFLGQGFNEIIPGQNTVKVFLVKYLVSFARQAHGNTGNTDRAGIQA